jgi:hypothetical protein
MKYLYNYRYLYPVGKQLEEVQELTLECYDVTPTFPNLIGASSWDFKVVGRGDQLFHTSYDWSLVENTPENLEIIAEFKVKQIMRDALQDQASKVFKRIRLFNTPPEIEETK